MEQQDVEGIIGHDLSLTFVDWRSTGIMIMVKIVKSNCPSGGFYVGPTHLGL